MPGGLVYTVAPPPSGGSLRVWFNGRTRASQARNGGSIPLTRSLPTPSGDRSNASRSPPSTEIDDGPSRQMQGRRQPTRQLPDAVEQPRTGGSRQRDHVAEGGVEIRESRRRQHVGRGKLPSL